MNNPKKAEILAPAGSFASLEAAIGAGADAVYLGGDALNARASAANFDRESLRRAVSLAHAYGVKIYVTVNILLEERELEELLDCGSFLWEIGADAAIVQDLGVLRLLKENFPDLELHGSTQMSVHNLEGAKVAKELGLSRIVLARETPLSEISRIKENLEIEVEFFCHGALCVCYSGQCLMSSMIGGRSGNRGACAQPCRKHYRIVDGKEILRDGYVISPKDLSTAEEISALLEAGVDSLKIEGRMKKPAYVDAVTRMMRHARDGQFSENDLARAKETFNRGLTKGLFLGDFGRSFISEHRPDNRGIDVGEVTGSSRGKVRLRLRESLRAGDGLSWDLPGGSRTGLTLREDLPQGEVELFFREGAKVGSRLWKSGQDEELPPLPTLPLLGAVTLHQGKSAEVVVKKGDEQIVVQGDEVQEAKKSPLTEEMVRAQMEKLGDTPFSWEELAIDVEEGSFLPKSALNDLRRKAVAALLDESREPRRTWHIPQVKPASLTPHLTIYAPKNFSRVDPNRCDRLIVDLFEAREGRKHVKDGCELFGALPLIGYGEEMEKTLLEVKRAKAEGLLDGILVRGLSGIFIGHEVGLPMVGDITMQVTNTQSMEVLRELGLSELTYSPELTFCHVEELTKKGSLPGEILAYGYVPAMWMEHCPMSLVKNCKDNRECRHCSLSHEFALKDDRGYEFPFERVGTRTRILHSRPLFLGRRLMGDGKRKSRRLRVDVLREGEPVELVQEYFFQLLRGEKPSTENLEEVLQQSLGGTTIGNMKRSIFGGAG